MPDEQQSQNESAGKPAPTTDKHAGEKAPAKQHTPSSFLFQTGITPPLRPRPLDWFVLVNTGLFLALCVFTYFERFLQYRGAANIHEFFIYALAILASIAWLWIHFRRYDFEASLLILLEAGILMHFAGAFVQFDDHRLYDLYLLDVRYDKYVHFTNAFVGALLVWKILCLRQFFPSGVNIVFVPLIVLGLGCIVEIVEYLVMTTVQQNGVGGYHNNMQDLISNLAGSILATLVLQYRARLQVKKAGTG